MKRISRLDLFMEIAMSISKRASCDRLHVGVLALRERRIVVTGYNGPPKGQPHCHPVHCGDSADPCKRAIHAEANMVAFAAKKGISMEGTVIMVTHSPCLKCAELLVQSGIVALVYSIPYRDSTGALDLLKQANIQCFSEHQLNNDQSLMAIFEALIS